MNREGVKRIENGGFGGHGRLILTKVVDDQTLLEDQILEIVSNIKFPCFVTIDGNGFLEKPQEDKNDIIFCQSTVNTGLEFSNGKNLIYVSDKKSMQDLKTFAKELSHEEFLDRWFRQHDKASDLRGSGFRPRRVINFVITLDPTYLPVSKLV